MDNEKDAESLIDVVMMRHKNAWQRRKDCNNDYVSH